MSAAETVAFTVRLPKPLHEALQALAERERSSINREVFVACRAHVDADKRQKTR